MSIHKYSYRVLQATWGIRIDIEGEYIIKESFLKNGDCISIMPGLWGLQESNNIIKEEEHFLWDGLKYVSNLIITSEFYKPDSLIIIKSVDYNHCDFQPEGLKVAIIKWAAKAFHFNEPNIVVTYNGKENHYDFYYP